MYDIYTETNDIYSDYESKQWYKLGQEIGDLIISIKDFGDLSVVIALVASLAEKWGYKLADDLAQFTEENWEKVKEETDEFLSDTKIAYIKAKHGIEDAAKDVAKGSEEAAKDVAKGTTEAADDVASGTTEAADDVAKGSEEAADDVAKGSEEAADDVAHEADKAAKETEHEADKAEHETEHEAEKAWDDVKDPFME